MFNERIHAPVGDRQIAASNAASVAHTHLSEAFMEIDAALSDVSDADELEKLLKLREQISEVKENASRLSVDEPDDELPF